MKFQKTTLFLVLMVTVMLGSCCPKIINSISAKKSLPSSLVIKKSVEKQQQSIQIAKNFMEIAYGRTIAIDLIGNYPPSATFYPQTKRWNVFFTNGVSTCNVELDNQLVKGTVSRMDGKIYKRFSNEDATIYKLPLFTLDEFMEITKFPHNKFS